MAYPPYYGAAVGYQVPHARPGASPQSYTQAARAGQLTGLGQLGGLQLGAQQLATVLGSAVGGGGVGYVALPDKEGILRGAVRGVSLSMLGETLGAARVGAVPNAAVTGVLTLAAGGYALWRMRKRRRWT